MHEFNFFVMSCYAPKISPVSWVLVRDYVPDGFLERSHLLRARLSSPSVSVY